MARELTRTEVLEGIVIERLEVTIEPSEMLGTLELGIKLELWPLEKEYHFKRVFRPDHFKSHFEIMMDEATRHIKIAVAELST